MDRDGSDGAALPLFAAARSLSPGKVAQCPSKAQRMCSSVSLAADRWQTGLPALRLPDLLRLPPLGSSGALALQGLPGGFLGDIGHPVRLAQAAGVVAGMRNWRCWLGGVGGGSLF